MQELVISTWSIDFFEFELQHATFPSLRILGFPNRQPRFEVFMKFLEDNGKNLDELNVDINESSKLPIGRFCPNLKKLSIVLLDNEIDLLKTIFNSFQYLKSIKVWCGDEWLNEKNY